MIKEFFQNWLGMDAKQKQQTTNGDVLVSIFGESSVFDLSKAIAAYDENVWVNAAVSLRAETFANVKLYLWDNKKKERIDEHPVLDLLNRPSEFIPRFNMYQMVEQHLSLTGNAYWKYDFEGSTIVRIQPLLPQFVEIIVSEQDFVKEYRYTFNGRVFHFPPEEVTHFVSASPASLVQGSAPIFSARYAIDTETQSNRWNFNFFKNGASVGAILEHANTLTDAVKDRIKQAFDSRHKTEVKAFKTIVLDGGLKLKEPTVSQKDMEFSTLQMNNRDKVIAVYRTPKQLLAQFEGGSLAEARTSENIFAKYTMTPELQLFVETLDLDLLPLFGIENQELSLRFEPIVLTDREFELKKDDAALDKWMTRNERRKKEGLEPPMDGGDELYNPVSNVPLDFSSEVGESNTEEKAVESIDIKQQHIAKRAQYALKKDLNDFKQAYGRKFLINHALLEMKFIKRLKKAFADQKKRVLEALRKNKQIAKTKSLADDVFDVEEETKLFVKIFTPLISEIAAQNGDAANMVFGLGLGPLEQIDSFAGIVNDLTFTFAEEVSKTTQQQIRNQLASGLAEGEGVDELGKRMSGIFKNASVVRSQTIARTETTKASSKGTLLAYDESGVVAGKEWLAVHDDRTRPDHVEANGQVRKLDEDFDVDGESLAAPGTGSVPSNNINCRCTILPVII